MTTATVDQSAATQQPTTADPFAFLKGNGNGDAAATLPVEPAKAAATTPTPTPTPAPTKTRSTSTKLPLYIDIETIPDESREHLFGLEPIPDEVQEHLLDLAPIPTPMVFAAEADCPLPSELLRGTIDEIKAAMQKVNATGKSVPRTILEGSLKMESAASKPRKGVVDLLAGLIRLIEGEAATIQSAIEARRQAVENAIQSRLNMIEARRKTMSLTPEMCRVVAIGFAVGSEPAQSLVVGQPSADGQSTITEEMILTKFWELAGRNGGPIVGFNVLGFDLPVLFVRSILLGVDATKKLDMKPWGADVVDLMAVRFPKSQAKPLKSLATWMGIPIPAEGVDGSQVAGLFASDPKKLGEYVRSDIQITRELHRRYRGTFC